MLPPSVEDAISTIGEDHTSGASRIARVALETMTLLVVDAKGHPEPEDLKEAANRISAAQPAMAVVHNVVHMFTQLVAEGLDPMTVRQQLLDELNTAKERIARTYLKIAPDEAVLVTTSFSDNVLATLQHLHDKARLARVFVLESRPLLEGRFLVVALQEAGIPASLAPDALGPSLVGQSSGVLVGADSVLRDGAVVNKIGSYGLALAAKAHGRPFHVACETLKFDARHDAASWPGSPAMKSKEVWENPPERIEVVNRYFEVVPASLVTAIVTERGSFAPDLVKTMLAQAKGR
jgi:translation initiation factor 2B subunit (eIF-2B alpha/beta/delta family)